VIQSEPVPTTSSPITATAEWSFGSSTPSSQTLRNASGSTSVRRSQRVTSGRLRQIRIWSRSASVGGRRVIGPARRGQCTSGVVMPHA